MGTLHAFNDDDLRKHWVSRGVVGGLLPDKVITKMASEANVSLQGVTHLHCDYDNHNWDGGYSRFPKYPEFWCYDD